MIDNMVILDRNNDIYNKFYDGSGVLGNVVGRIA